MIFSFNHPAFSQVKFCLCFFQRQKIGRDFQLSKSDMTSFPLPGRIEQVYAAPSLRWDLKFTRRNPKLYELEDKKPFKPDHTKGARQRIDQFFDEQTHMLLPKSYSYQALRDFLAFADTSVFEQGSLPCLNMPDLVETVLFDERTDDQSLNMFTSRQWQGYEQYPPKGIAEYTAALTPKECYEKLSHPVCLCFNFLTNRVWLRSVFDLLT